jgi:hypothetical protein
MRHADDDLLQPELTAALDHLLERRHRRLAAVSPNLSFRCISPRRGALKISASISFEIAFLP